MKYPRNSKFGDSTYSFVVFADVQYDDYAASSSSINELGETNRLEICRRAMEYVGDYCVSNQIDSAICVGDLLDKKGSTSSKVLHSLKKVVEERFSKVPLYILAGNHDWIDKAGTRSLTDLFSGSNVVSITKPSELVISAREKIRFSFLPDVEEPVSSLSLLGLDPECPFKFLFAHVGIHGAWMSSFAKSESPVTVADLKEDRYDLVFLGDYHRHQYLSEKTCYTGALLQKSFSHEGDPQMFFHVTINFKTAEIIQKIVKLPPSFPEFRTIDFEDSVPSEFKGYLKVRSDSVHLSSEVASKLEKLPEGCVVFSEVPQTVSLQDPVRMKFPASFQVADQCLFYFKEKAAEPLSMVRLMGYLTRAQQGKRISEIC